MTQDWSRLFAESGFRWRLGLRAGQAHAFFAPTSENRDVLAERGHCLDESPADYAVLIDAGQPLLEEMGQFAVACGAVASVSDHSLEMLGRTLEPDFVLLVPSPNGPIVAGGVVCFPSSWALPEKIGRTLHETHGPVPALNPHLGERIRTALDRLAPGDAWERDNWGLSRDAKRNHHPHRDWKRLDETIEPKEVWLRVERQILYRLPQTGGILFGIRLEITPWREFVQSDDAAAGLRRSLESMPAEIASYKDLSSARSKILGWLTG
jgi:dimethylamine monooxygenase subunit A